MMRLATFLVCVSVTATLAGAPRSADAATGTRSNADLQQLLRQGKPVVRRGITIWQTLDLRPIGVVKAVFVCRDCVLLGGLVASNVVFERPVDLGGMTLVGGLDLHGATFKAPAIFGAPWADDTSLGGRLDFSLTTFEDLAAFEDVTFTQPVDFRLTRFRSGSAFNRAVFEGHADFTGASFREQARFEQARFGGTATFERAFFQGLADFRQGEFDRDADFARAAFAQRADFSQAMLTEEATFARSRFDDGATFFGGRFSGERSESAVTFERAASEGTLEFANRRFGRDAIFRNMVARSLSFDDARIAPNATLWMEGISVDDLVLSVDDAADHVTADHVNSEDEHRVLGLIESSAKSRGDLRLANRAHYRLQVVASRDDARPLQILDLVFYRGVAGYFVDPTHPLSVLVAIALLSSVYRYVRHRGFERGGASPKRRGRARIDRWLRSAPARLRGGLDEFIGTLSLIGRGKSDSGRRFERLVYRALVVCVLLGLANSNPTLRQMVDALL